MLHLRLEMLLRHLVGVLATGDGLRLLLSSTRDKTALGSSLRCCIGSDCTEPVQQSPYAYGQYIQKVRFVFHGVMLSIKATIEKMQEITSNFERLVISCIDSCDSNQILILQRF